LLPSSSPDLLAPVSATARRSGVAGSFTLALFVLLAVLHTWPLAAAPGHWSRNDTGDTVLHEWIMAWVAHQMVTDPIHLFDANIFYPERGTLAYSDHLFVQAMMGAPLLWAGASPVLVHNLVLLAGFALTGWTTCLVVGRWTGSVPAGVLSGSLVAFNSFSLTRLPQIQDLHLEFFPLVLLALDRLLVMPRARHAAALAGWFVLQSLTGTYLMVFTAIAVIAAALARPVDWWGRRFPRVAGGSLLSAALAIAVLLPFLLPYYRAGQRVGLVRSLQETERYSAQFTDYLAAAGRIHFGWWSERFFAGDALFPGIAALLLGAIGIAYSGLTDRRARMVLVLGTAAFALSFGPAFPPYRWLYRVFPLLTGIRGAVRFGQIALAAIGILAGFGLVAVLRRVPRQWAVAAGLIAIVSVNAEAWRAPLWYFAYPGIPPIYDSLAQLGRNAVIAWLPLYPAAQAHSNTPYMLFSTRGWQPMLNGYSGFRPESYYRHARELAAFPDRNSVRYLQQSGVSYVVTDTAAMEPAAVARLETVAALHPWKAEGNVRIFVLSDED
jgi:hypothetical protein